MMGRRGLTLAAPLVLGVAAARAAEAALPEVLARIEAGGPGRLGVAVLDSAGDHGVPWRGEERFPMCSTFKLLLAGAVLARVDAGQERLERRLPVPREAVIAGSPGTGPHAGGDMAVGELCTAAMTLSDNTAANLLLGTLGGPAGLTAWLRRIGDDASRLDRTEPELNLVPPGDERDTTTPRAMLATAQALLLGTVLAAPSRAQLLGWMLDCRTNDARLKAGLPPPWRVGSKTGTASNTANEVAILWPPARPPLLVVALLADSPAEPAANSARLAAVGRAIAAAYER